MIRFVTVFVLGCMVVLGCAVRPAPEDATGSSDSTGVADAGQSSGVPTTSAAGSWEPQPGTNTTDATGTTGGMTSSTTSPGSTTESDTCGFICGPGCQEEPMPCSVFQQNCPEGEKCSAYANPCLGTSWNDAKCVPVQGDGQPGDPCTAAGMGLSGFDDCAEGARCWEVDEMDHGTCVALCTGSEAAPMCEEGFACVFSEFLFLCLPACDPLMQNCVDGDVCIPFIDSFVCVLGRSPPGQVFDTCEYANSCDVGLYCTATAAIECDANAIACCVPFCDVTDPDFVCPGTGQACVSMYEAGMAPPEYAKVGICIIPG